MDVAVERDHVRRVYSQIATHFSDTRYKPWPRIEQFLLSQPPGSLVADIGCGNGKYLGVNPAIYKLGSDVCPELVAIAGQRGHEVALCDCLSLPYRSNRFDAVICIAVVHHLSTPERRAKAVRELARILRPGGRLLVYVWAVEQEGKKFDGQDVLVPWHLQPKYSARDEASKGEKEAVSRERRKRRHRKDPKQTVMELARPSVQLAGAEFKPDDVGQPPDAAEGFKPVDSGQSAVGDRRALPGTERLTSSPNTASAGSCAEAHTKDGSDLAELGYQTFLRYYHVFRKGELSALFENGGASDMVVIEEVYDHENWCVTAEKIAST